MAGARSVSSWGRSVSRSFYDRDPRQVAPELLGKLLVRGTRAARIVEVEAYYGRHDPASHARNGPTPRNAAMFGPPGHWYVYFTYGMHWCANVVCGPEGEAAAVLLRAASPVAGLAIMRRCRPAARRDRELCSGPARLCQSFGVDGRMNGTDAVRGSLVIADDGVAPPDIVSTTRIGISGGTDLPWRWLIPGDEHVSRPAARPRRSPAQEDP
jgi:DNA-3-methyladenine glycosylase